MAGMVTARAWQSVRPHIPLIKFRKGGLPRDDPRSSGSSGPSAPPVVAASGTAPPKRSLKAPAQPTIEDFQLPHRYRRQLIDEKEIEYINRGGPE